MSLRRSNVKPDSRRRVGLVEAQSSGRPLALLVGESVLLFLFVALLAGRFTLSRIDDDATGLDLRWVFLGLGVFAVMLWWAGAYEYLPKRVPLVGFIPFGAWCVWMVTSAAWAPPGARVEEVRADLLFLLALLGLAWFVMSWLPSESLDRVWTWLMVTGLIYFVLALAAGPDGQGRFAAPGGGPNTFVRIMMAAAVAALYLAVVKGKNWALLTVPVFAVGAALSGSRGGLLSAAVALLVFIIPVVRRLGAGRTLGIAILGAVGAVAAGFWRGGYVYQFVHERFIVQTLREGYSSGRDTISEQSWGMFLEDPIVGVGLDGFFPLQLNASAAYEHPHNLVVATLAEAGAIGGLLLAVALLRPVLASLGRPMPQGPFFALLTGLYFFGAAMFSGDYYDSRFIWFFLGLAAIGAIRARQDDDFTIDPIGGQVEARAI